MTVTMSAYAQYASSMSPRLNAVRFEQELARVSVETCSTGSLGVRLLLTRSISAIPFSIPTTHREAASCKWRDWATQLFRPRNHSSAEHSQGTTASIDCRQWYHASHSNSVYRNWPRLVPKLVLRHSEKSALSRLWRNCLGSRQQEVSSPARGKKRRTVELGRRALGRPLWQGQSRRRLQEPARRPGRTAPVTKHWPTRPPRDGPAAGPTT